MPVWEPKADQPVGAKEMLGRRIFSDKIWDGAFGNGRKLFRVDHFLDMNREADLSLDRLGRSSEEGAVVRRVGHHAHTEGDQHNPPRPFTGWAACGRNHFATAKCNVPVEPRPLEDGTNPYHAEIVRDDYRGRSGPYAFATMIRDVVSQQGHFRNSPPRRTPKGSGSEADTASGPTP
jgi:hypothetical protein